MAKRRSANQNSGANLGFEEKLWAAADKLRGHTDAAEYAGLCKSASLEEVTKVSRSRCWGRGSRLVHTD